MYIYVYIYIYTCIHINKHSERCLNVALVSEDKMLVGLFVEDKRSAPDWAQHSMISVEKLIQIRYSTEHNIENNAVQKKKNQRWDGFLVNV